MHFVLGLDGDVKVRSGGSGRWVKAAGVLTAADAVHAIDARGTQVLLVFLDPESDLGAALAPTIVGSFRRLSRDQCATLARDATPGALERGEGLVWSRRAMRTLGDPHRPTPLRPIHPRVRKVLRLLRAGAAKNGTSLDALARAVALSPGRLIHVFTQSIGIPLRPYLAWLKLQRSAGALVAGATLSDAAIAAGFSDAAHMTRTFRRMFGVPPSVLRVPPPAPAGLTPGRSKSAS